jgi:uncharacterized protein YabE (DUF348 family)
MKRKHRSKWARFNRYRRRHIRRLRILSRHPFAVPVITIFGLFILTIGVYHLVANSSQLKVTPDSKIVIISHDGTQQVVPSDDKTVGALLKRLNLKLGQGDVVEPSPTTPINQDDFRINIYRAVPVEVVDGSNITYSFSAATTPRAIAEQAGLNLYPQDIVTSNPVENFLKGGAIGEQVVIDRATPVNLNLYGTPLLIRTHAETVAELIKQEKIKLAADDQVDPSPSTELTANSEVFIVRHGTKIESVTETIPTPIQTIDDQTLAYGTSAVRQQGSAGQEVITYQEALQNNVVVSRTEIQSVVTVPAVTEIVVEGTSLSGIKGDMALAGIAPSDYQYVDYIVSHESGWCPTKAQGEHYCPAVPDNSETPNGYGLCQATPGYKMASAGADWATNPITQLKWCSGYADERYGSWYNAYEHWIINDNW